MRRYYLVALIFLGQLAMFSTAQSQEQRFPRQTKDVVWIEKNDQGESIVHLYVYWSLVCPHCEKSSPYIKNLAKTNPWLKLHFKEVSKDPKNLTSLYKMAETLDEPNSGEVPAFFFCGIMYTGYGENKTTGAWIKDTLKECHAQ